ncbi:MAG: hypothetical protein IPK59_17945 [Rhodospirillaceae bacterium]|nr:hypothetical protein [Rhodospirillaceae bacterium]
MGLFMVSYDLIKNKDYKKLLTEIGRMNSRKALASLYLMNVDGTGKDLKDHLAQYIDDDDKLMVIEFTKRPNFTKANDGTNKWLDENL